MLQSFEMNHLKHTAQLEFTARLDPSEFCIISPPIHNSTPATPALPVHDYSVPWDASACVKELQFIAHRDSVLKSQKKLEIDIERNILHSANKCASNMYRQDAHASWPT